MKFCQKPNVDNYNETFDIRQELESEQGIKEEDLPILKVNTSEQFVQGFKFDTVAKYDYSMEQLNDIEAAQKNFNNNLDNEKVRDEFI